MQKLDLSGKWRYQNHNAEETGVFTLPGSTCSNGIGKKGEYYDAFSAEAVRAPREKCEYTAPLWLNREVSVPESFKGRVKLFLERVNIASQLWVDGEIKRQIIGLSTPHIYDLGQLAPGMHTFTLCIDNRNLLNIGDMASGYSVDTSGYWNGIAGRVELICEDVCHIEGLQVYPDDKGIDIKLTQTSDVYSPFEQKAAVTAIEVITPTGESLGTKRFERQLYNSKQVEYYRYDIDSVEYWDEFNPRLYTLIVKYQDDEKQLKFGMRTIKRSDRQIILNNKPISLRGTTDCGIFPLTGYPPTDVSFWRERLNRVKEYGLNHVRFHSWCPPDAAFTAADELGVYLLVEMPLWLNRDVCPIEVGEDTLHRKYFASEAIEISKAYGNHPSFIMFSCGNENMGDFELLEDIIIQAKAYDNRRIYTLTTNFDHPLLPCEDFLCAYEASGEKVRLQNLHSAVAKGTCLDYTEAVRKTKVPVIGFEVGQYLIYPDVDSIEKYQGNILPVNFDAIRKHMIQSGVYPRLKDYIKASGDIAIKLYKEDIEAALRTKGFGGFELLSLSDYTGQSTATVGILDAFYDSKGVVERDEWTKFCNNVVPLFKAGRIFKNTECIDAELDLYDYGEERITDPVFKVTVTDGERELFCTETKSRNITIPLDGVLKSAILTVKVRVNEYENSWRVFVFCDEPHLKAEIITTKAELDSIVKNGGVGIVTREMFTSPTQGSFVPVFWSPVHFASTKPCGAIIDQRHPVFKYFPTEKYPDYQWQELLDKSVGERLDKIPEGFRSIIETVPNFAHNIPTTPLFEGKAGNGWLIYCGFDLAGKGEAEKAFKNALIKYAKEKSENV